MKAHIRARTHLFQLITHFGGAATYILFFLLQPRCVKYIILILLAQLSEYNVKITPYVNSVFNFAARLFGPCYIRQINDKALSATSGDLIYLSNLILCNHLSKSLFRR